MKRKTTKLKNEMVSPRKAMAMGFQMGGAVDVKRANVFAQNLGQMMQSPTVVRKPRGMM
jgi:hypothetical protein|tara:strand:+ start:240 stop:416 length:177 start_codon:yes stop_codon:yes gene_type:complete